MNFKTIALSLVLALTSATAGAGNNNGPDFFGGGDQAQTQMQGQIQGQVQGQAQNTTVGVDSSNRNTNTNIVGGGQGGQGGSVNLVIPEGGLQTTTFGEGTVKNSFSIPEGAIQVSPSTALGDTTSTSSVVSGGTETDQDVTIDTSDNSTQNVTYTQKFPVSSAAAVYATTCSTGMSGQSDKFGAAITTSDPLCDAIKVSAYWQGLYESETDPEIKSVYEERYRDSVDYVNTLADGTEAVGFLDRFFGFLVKPVAVLGVLVWLL